MSFFNELKRRNVFKVAAAYIIAGWVSSTLAFFLILGFPIAMIFAWAFEMTPEGLKKECHSGLPPILSDNKLLHSMVYTL